MPKLLYYGEIPTFSCSLGINSAMQSRTVSTEVNEMALSQITMQYTEEDISEEGEKPSFKLSVYFIWSRALNVVVV